MRKGFHGKEQERALNWVGAGGGRWVAATAVERCGFRRLAPVVALMTAAGSDSDASYAACAEAME